MLESGDDLIWDRSIKKYMEKIYIFQENIEYVKLSKIEVDNYMDHT